MIQLDRDGFIRGGMAYKRVQRRSGRASGSRQAWKEIAGDKKYVKVNNGWYQIIKVPYDLYKLGSYGGGDIEVGYLRMHQDVFPQLVKDKVKFRLKHMDLWVEGIAACEFQISGESPLSIITKGEGIQCNMKPPKGSDDFLYNREHPEVPMGIAKG